MADDPRQPIDLCKLRAKRAISLPEFMAKELPPPRWIVGGLIPEGLTLLAAKAKIGKSTLARGISLAVAWGGVALGRHHVEAGGVLYISLEDGEARFQAKLRTMLDGQSPPAAMDVQFELSRLNEGGVDEIREWLDDHPEARLVVLDCLVRVLPSADSDRLFASDYKALSGLQQLAIERRVGILVIHHLRKPPGEDWTDCISGTTGLSAAADGLLVVMRRRARKDAFMGVANRDGEDQELWLKFDGSRAEWWIAGTAEEMGVTQEQEAILETLEEAEEAMPPRALASLLQAPVNAVQIRLHRMVKAGLVTRASYGRYTLPSRQQVSDVVKECKSGLLQAELSASASQEQAPETLSPFPERLKEFSGRDSAPGRQKHSNSFTLSPSQVDQAEGLGPDGAHLRAFLGRCTKTGPGVPCDTLRTLYHEDCRQQGATPLPETRFIQLMEAAGFARGPAHWGDRMVDCWHGLQSAPPEEYVR